MIKRDFIFFKKILNQAHLKGIKNHKYSEVDRSKLRKVNIY